MTTPVITQSSEKIAMTTPVITSKDNKMMTMSFVVPSKYTLDSLPIPHNDRVQLVEVLGYKVAVYQFTRWTPEKRVTRLTEQLREKLQRDDLPSDGIDQLMRYNPPFTAPFMRRNEIVINI